MSGKATKIEKGMKGQLEAERHLTGKGIKILERNYRLRSGEIDLIASEGEYILFIEVKYRTGTSYGYPRESVNALKQQKIKKTALHYINFKKFSDDIGFRFDVVEIIDQDGVLETTHIENAFW